MSSPKEKSCPKFVSYLTNMPKNTEEVSPLVTFILRHGIGQTLSSILEVVSTTFLQFYFVCLKESTSEIRKNVFYFTSKALFVLEIIKF